MSNVIPWSSLAKAPEESGVIHWDHKTDALHERQPFIHCALLILVVGVVELFCLL